MHGGVGLCSCRHLVDEVCEGPVVPVTLVVNITEFEVARARGFGGLALERGDWSLFTDMLASRTARESHRG